MRGRGIWLLVKDAMAGFSEHEVLTLGAALAYFMALSLAPMLVVLLTIAGMLGPDVQARFVEQMTQLVGPNAGEALRGVIESARSEPRTGVVSAILGVAMLLVAATGALAQLQDSLNVI